MTALMMGRTLRLLVPFGAVDGLLTLVLLRTALQSRLAAAGPVADMGVDHSGHSFLCGSVNDHPFRLSRSDFLSRNRLKLRTENG